MLFNCAILDALGAALVPNTAINELLGDTKLQDLPLKWKLAPWGGLLTFLLLRLKLHRVLRF